MEGQFIKKICIYKMILIISALQQGLFICFTVTSVQNGGTKQLGTYFSEQQKEFQIRYQIKSTNTNILRNIELLFQTMMVLCQEQGDVSMTYRECQKLSIQIARYFQQQGYKKV